MIDLPAKPKLPAPSGSDAAPEEVGYGKPPIHSRFKPGQSGNPSGRPKGAKNKKPKDRFEEPLDQILLDEAYRDMLIQDGNGQRKMPAIQAVVRTVFHKALKGDHRSQRLMLEHTSRVEGRKRALAEAHVEAMMDYKLYWENELDRRQKRGITGPAPYPHPDDIILDFATGDVRIEGPLDKNEEEYVDLVVIKNQAETFLEAAQAQAKEKPECEVIQERVGILSEKKQRIEAALVDHPGGGRFR